MPTFHSLTSYSSILRSPLYHSPTSRLRTFSMSIFSSPRRALLLAAAVLPAFSSAAHADTPTPFSSDADTVFYPRLTAERVLRWGAYEEKGKRKKEKDIGDDAFSFPLSPFSFPPDADAEQTLLLDDMQDAQVVPIRRRSAPRNAVPNDGQNDTRRSLTLDSALPFASQPSQYGPLVARSFGHMAQKTAEGIYTFSDGVQIVYTDPRDKAQTTLTAESAEYNYRTGLVTAHQGARLERSEGSFVGDDITYNVITRAGFTTNAIAETDYFRMRGRRIEALPDGSYVVEDGVFTTCIRGRPDYQIRARRLTVKPNQYVSARGATVFAGPTRLVTLPTFRRSLAAGSSLPIPTPGYDKSDGVFARLRDTPLLDPHRSLQYDGRVGVRRLPAGFVAYEFDIAKTAPRAPAPRTLRTGLDDPLHGYLEQLTPPTYREYAEDRYEDEFIPRLTAGVVVQNDQFVYNRRRTDLRVSRFPELALRYVNVLGRVTDPATLQDQPQAADRTPDGTPNGVGGAVVNPILQRVTSAPFLLDFDLRAGGVTEYPTRVTSGRISFQTTAATQPLLIGRRISLRFAISDWLNAYSAGSMYNLFSPETELDYLPTRTTRIGVGYRFSDDLGRTPFVFDHQDVRSELRLLFQTGGPFAFGYEAKFDLERSRQYDGEFAVLRDFDCMQAGVAYRQRSQSFNVIFRLLPPTRDRAARRAQPLQAIPGSRPGG